MIQWLKENPKHILIVPTLHQQIMLEDKYPELKDRIICYSRKERLLGQNDILGIDNLDMLKKHIFRKAISVVTLS